MVEFKPNADVVKCNDCDCIFGWILGEPVICPQCGSDDIDSTDDYQIMVVKKGA